MKHRDAMWDGLDGIGWIFPDGGRCRAPYGADKLQHQSEIHMATKKKQTPLFNTNSDNKEQRFETIGQSKSLHGKPFPTASQFQGQSRFEERW